MSSVKRGEEQLRVPHMRCEELLSMLSLLRKYPYVDKRGVLTSEGRGLLFQALRFIKEMGIIVDTRKLRKSFDIYYVDLLIARLEEMCETVDRQQSKK